MYKQYIQMNTKRYFKEVKILYYLLDSNMAVLYGSKQKINGEVFPLFHTRILRNRSAKRIPESSKHDTFTA